VFRGTTSLDRPDGCIVWRVERSPFLHEIVEKGELESGDSVEVRCEVKAQGIGRGRPPRPGEAGRGGSKEVSDQSPSGFMILEVVPEGTSVEQGDVLAILDSSGLKEELVDQQIACALAEAAVIRAKNDFETAQIALQEYLEGLRPQQQQAFENRAAMQTVALRQARQTLELTHGLHRQGFTTMLQVEADQHAAAEAQIELRQAQTALTSLNKYTGPRTTAELRAAIEVTKAKYHTETSNYELSLGKLEELKQQIDKCEIRAPLAGKVVYANKTGMNLRGPQIIIEPGATVRDGQTIIRLPNPESMQVKVLVDEENLALVRPGQSARFTMDALPGVELKGRVTKVNDYPEPAGDPRWATAGREYEATVSIHDPPPSLRPGMTAEVRVCVNWRAAQLQVPNSAVVRRGSSHFCILQHAPELAARRVTIGPSDGKFTVIEEGLREEDVVVLGAARYWDRAAPPKAPVVSGPQSPRGEMPNPAMQEGNL